MKRSALHLILTKLEICAVISSNIIQKKSNAKLSLAPVAVRLSELLDMPVAMASEVGRGQVVAFTQDVTMRAFLEGLKPLFLNAVFRGPAHTSGTRGD